jgi:hypothetical protein
MRVVIIVATVVALLGVLGSLQVLARSARHLPFEAPIRPLALGSRPGRVNRPAELGQLETLVADALRADRAATARLVSRLAAQGVDLPDECGPAELAAALRSLGRPATGATGPAAGSGRHDGRRTTA